MIDPAFRARIEAALAAIEWDETVRILLAVESGSRGWGFASRDSDYDVRFVFVRPAADYLRISPLRDVMERPIDDALDLSPLPWSTRTRADVGLLRRG